MSEQAVPSENMGTDMPVVTEVDTTNKQRTISGEEAVELLKEIQENAGQISELSMEEDMLVAEFLKAVMKILTPFAKNMQISTSSLPKKFREEVNQAYLDLTGHLVLIYKDGKVELLNLSEQENRDLLVEISGEVVVKLKNVVNLHRRHIEKRVKFLSSITGAIQKVAKVFSTEEISKS